MAEKKLDRIRNFSIIAHIDHGKSTLADRILEVTGVLSKREMEDQILDNMDLEKERGITIKARAVKLSYTAQDGLEYDLNLIDTPGHVDFTYEVSRSLGACEGAILIVDASQGVEAQTLANTYLAIDQDLKVIPVINKIDLPAARPEEVKKEIKELLGMDTSNVPLISAKLGHGIQEVLEQIILNIPPPVGDCTAPLRALIFDSHYDAYKGIVVYVRVIDGTISVGDNIKMMATGSEFEVVQVGYLLPNDVKTEQQLQVGEVGFVAASIKNLANVHVGDTITTSINGATHPLAGYKKVKPMVFSGIYPVDGARYDDLRDGFLKLQLNDASLSFEPETSVALGFGIRCGFLGLLHMEVITERLEREFNLELVITAPNVVYKVIKTDNSTMEIYNPANLPLPSEIIRIEEPIVLATLILPSEYVGGVMELCQQRRGIYKNMKYMDAGRVNLEYLLPLNEIVYDFFDTLKSRTKGYASFDYEFCEYQASNLVKLDILFNGSVADALSFIVHFDKAESRGRKIIEKLKENVPRQMFDIPIQAAIGGKIIARETIKAMRKNVLAKCYGGDITRKKKLLEKQKEGKKRMRKIGNVEVPKESFMEVLKLNSYD